MAKEFDPEEEAKNDALRDAVGSYGRTHASTVIKGSYKNPADHPYNPGGDNVYVSEVIPRHHTAETFHDRCKECVADAKRGEHPSAPKNRK